MTFSLMDCCARDAHDDAPIPRQQRGIARLRLCPPKKHPARRKGYSFTSQAMSPMHRLHQGGKRGIFLIPKPPHLRRRQDVAHWLQVCSHPLAHREHVCPTPFHQEKKTRSYSLLLFRSWSKDSLHSSTSREESLEKTKRRKAHCPAENTSPALR